jgi:molybdopterin-guanine dinucleotide biosynthesis protein A
MPDGLVTGIILAGGKSRRLGRDKTTLPWPPPGAPDAPAGTTPTLLAVTAGRLATVCAEVVLVGYRAERHPLPYRTVPDVYPDSGSLGGIYSGLAAAGQWSFAIAADMPFLNLALVRHMLSQPREWDALVPVIAGRPEPLHALYGPACLPAMRERIEARRLKIAGFFDAVRVCYLDEATVRGFDPELRSFFNINTPADLERARAMQQEA